MSRSAGRSGSTWRRAKVEVYARRAPCCRCHQAIDYSLPYIDPDTGKPHPDSKSVDHFPFPLSTHQHLAEDPANLAAAHLRCNLSAGDRGPQLDAGTPTEEW